ncbi:MAG: IS66 family transposase [Terriglobia bacterium]
MSAKPVTLDINHLPDDLEFLKQLVRDLVGETEDLRHKLSEALRQRFGRKSETYSEEQLELFLKQIQDKLKDQPKLPEVEPAPKAPFVGHGRRKTAPKLPRVEAHYPLPGDQKACTDCGLPLRKIGEESRTLYDYIPSSIVRREETREKWGCPKCADKVVASAFPPQAIERCMAGDGLLAQVAVSKFGYHLPLYRQSEIFSHQGFVVNRSTLCHWIAQVADVFDPVYRFMIAEALLSKVLHSDDTVVPVLEDRRGEGHEKAPPDDVGQETAADEPRGPRKAREGRLWTWVGDKDHPLTVFSYTPNREGEGPQDFLKPWKGFLQADAYAGYDALFVEGRGIVEVACWAHTRRKFFEAKNTDKSRCGEAIAFIHRLYEVERQAKDKSAAERRAMRQEFSKPVLEAFKVWLDAQAMTVLPKSPVNKAIGYALRQWKALERYVEDGDLAIDNNPAENALRCVAIGRKNYLFAGTDAGGHRAAVLYSLMASCKRHGLNPFDYLRDVLGRLALRPGAAELRELLPDHWKPPIPLPQPLQAAT